MVSHQIYVQLPTSGPRSTGHLPYHGFATPSPRRHSPRYNYYPSLNSSRSLTMFPTPSPKAPRDTPSSGYTVVSEIDAKRLVSTLLASTGYKEKRQEYVNQQRESREGGKADVVNLNECLEVAGEKSSTFDDIVRKLGIFDENTGEDTFVMYKKVPRTALQSKNKQPECEEDVLTYLFSRWMQVDVDSVKLVPQKSPDRTFKVWRSVRYMNSHLIYCQMFVISSEFNRHLFHKEILE